MTTMGLYEDPKTITIYREVQYVYNNMVQQAMTEWLWNSSILAGD